VTNEVKIDLQELIEITVRLIAKEMIDEHIKDCEEKRGLPLKTLAALVALSASVASIFSSIVVLLVKFS